MNPRELREAGKLPARAAPYGVGAWSAHSCPAHSEHCTSRTDSTDTGAADCTYDGLGAHLRDAVEGHLCCAAYGPQCRHPPRWRVQIYDMQRHHCHRVTRFSFVSSVEVGVTLIIETSITLQKRLLIFKLSCTTPLLCKKT